ncbi:cell division cycle-associated protein 7-like isoform X2 [Conger conger]|uniref:cell division cycle-associated protein 7-like isoform X2 n=1 Tax=Conger conger TaxID=82655 RepID=UPI002A5A3E85|nr:cell division cycle-associated protein 7-like isoform X2 [Conger conger]
MEKEGPLELSSLSRQLCDIFAEDSDNEHDRTFHGFCDDEVRDLDNDMCSDSEDYSEVSSPKRSPRPPQRFTLRVALRPRTRANHQEEAERRGVKKAIKSERGGNAIPFIPPTPTAHSNSDSEADSSQTFLEKRALNIKSNKAMLAQLMADLQKMPDSLLKTEGAQQKRPNARAPRASLAPGETRRNPERTSRRHTRSMGGCAAEGSLKEEQDLERSLEDALLEVRRPPRRRASPRPNPSNPHEVRPVEDITQDELDLVAESLVAKVYNRASGSTCHQCRQKTIDTKTCCRDEGCRGVQGQFCGPCLRNRIGGVRRAVGSVTAASAGTETAAAPQASCSPWRSTTASPTSTPTSAVFVIR